MERRKRNKVDTIERINIAVDALIKEKGVMNISIIDIAERAQVSTGSFYSYFDNIDYIYYKAIKNELHTRCLHLETILQNKDPIHDIELFLDNHFSFIQDDSLDYLQVSCIVILKNKYREFLNHKSPYYSLLLPIIKKGKEEGLFKNQCSTEVITLQIVNSLFGMCITYMLGNGNQALKSQFKNYIFTYLHIDEK